MRKRLLNFTALMKHRKYYRKINIKEFASLMGVSTATVSRAFSTKGRISEKTRCKILEKAANVGYRPNANARNLILKTNNNIGFFYPSLIHGEPDYFISEIMQGINEAVNSVQKTLQIYPVQPSKDNNMDFYKNIILNGSMAGIIFISGVPTSDELIKLAEKSQIPCIKIGPKTKGLFNSVSFNLEKGSILAGKYLKGIGRKHPAYVKGLHDESKLFGFKKGLGRLAGKLLVDQGGSTFHDGAESFARIISSNPKVDSVFCANDIIAIGFIRAALNRGKKIPEDIAVIGCDDVKIAQYYNPALTSIQLHEYDIGQQAVSLLERLIAGETKLESKLIETELIVRESA